MRRKSDPSRVAERDRRAAGHGDRVAPRDCADAGLGLPARTGGGQAFGTAGCSRCGHGRRPRRWRRAGRTGDRFAGGAGRPRRRSAQGRLRLDSAPNPWHNSRDWLGLSELETVTRAPDGTPGPHPTPESVSYATRTRRPSPAPGLWTLTLLWTQRARPQGACKTAQTRFCTAPTATILVGSSRPGRDGTTGRQRRQPSRFAHFFMTADRKSSIFADCVRAAEPIADVLSLDAVTLETDRRFDAIYSNKVLHHLTPDELARSLRAQRRLLREGGLALARPLARRSAGGASGRALPVLHGADVRRPDGRAVRGRPDRDVRGNGRRRFPVRRPATPGVGTACAARRRTRCTSLTRHRRRVPVRRALCRSKENALHLIDAHPEAGRKRVRRRARAGPGRTALLQR